MKKNVTLILKIAITMAIFYFLFRDQNFKNLYELYNSSDKFFILYAIITIITSIYIMSIRWSRINQIFGFSSKITSLFKNYLIAYGFNVFLPSSIGGDVWRIRYLNKLLGDKLNSVASPFLERVTGLIAILCVSPIVFLEFSEYLNIKNTNSIAVLFILFFICVLLLLFTKIGVVLSKNISQRLSSKIWSDRLEKITDSLELIRSNRIRMIEGIVLSIITQITFTFSSWFILSAFGSSISVYQFYLISIVVYIVTTLPISFNGLGVREAVIIWGLKKYGIQNDHASITALFITFLSLVPSFLGGIVFLLTKEDAKHV